MRKSTKIVKRFLVPLLIVLMSINTLAAIVGDNDGAAFITNELSDEMKKEFN